MTINECKANLRMISIFLDDNEQAELISLTCKNACDWLEELKELREQIAEMQCERQADFVFMVEHDKEVYNKALGNFVEKIELKYLGVHPDELHEPHYAYEIVKDIKKIAEHLKKSK